MLAAHAGAGAPAQMDRELDAAETLDQLVDHVDREIGGAVGVVILGAHLGVDEQAEMRIVDLHDVGTGLDDQLELAPEDRHAVAHEGLACRIGLARALGVPEPLAQQGRGGQRDLGLPRRDRFQEPQLAGDEAGCGGDQLVGDDGPGPAVLRIGLQREAVCQLGDHADIGLAAPFAVGHDVEAGMFLERHDVADGGRHLGFIALRRQRRASVDQVAHEIRARHGTDDGGGEERAHGAGLHRACASSMSSCVSISR